MDRISQLPDVIVHHILSLIYYTPAELVRMSVLSKHWFHLTASFPVLFFDMGTFRPEESFFKYVEYTTSRFCQHNVTAHTFYLVAWIRKIIDFNIIKRCVQLVLENGVREFVIEVATFSGLPKYCLPDVLLSVSVLKHLEIRGCKLPSSLMVNSVKLKSLIRLTLRCVTIDDEAIENLTTNFPLLKTFEIEGCHGFKRFCVYGHQNLQKVCIYDDSPLERIEIQAPNMSDFLLVNSKGISTPQMNFASCKKLTTLTCGDLVPNSNGFYDMLFNFPFIENLNLLADYMCKNIKLSSHLLRTLVLHSRCDLKDIEFNTPNLVLFVYVCSISLSWRPIILNKQWPLLRDSKCLKPCMHCYSGGDIDPLWLHKLRLFLDQKNGFKVLNLYIRAFYKQNIIEIDKQKLTVLPPYDLEHVELQLETRQESSAHIAFVEAVLLCCRPRSLTLRSYIPLTDFEDVVKFTCEKLLEQEDQSSKNIQIVSPSSSQAQKHVRDLKSISIALPRDGNAVSFKKEEVV